ncbi:Tetratricopeptide repeat-containing protein [Formosa sp. Hel1_31_208]|uniref:tetratricopeptide repeat-containing sensor histidine kinase n=1 Tax=Formosa sp. Hel1_31_208 TaxID=1798225 RepID=UPI00087DF104|nr:sensor histidine kinase [Formosa sp. Hel1_31_208]SDS12731.1 Tetratricopeptide repeat-containing protein [Formosa sp. Hel1_31_208]
MVFKTAHVTSKLLAFFILLISTSVMCQTKDDDLLKLWRNSEAQDSSRAIAFNKFISNNYVDSKTDSAYILVNTLIRFTKDKNIPHQHADALTTLGNILKTLGDYPKAAEYYKEGLKIYKKTKNKKGEATALNNIGSMYKLSWDLDEALKFYQESKEISTTINDTLAIATSLMNIGNIYNVRYKADIALDYYNESLNLLEAVKNKKTKAIILLNIGHSYTIKKENDLAMQSIKEGIRIGKSINNDNIQANGYNVLAANYFKRKKYDELIENAHNALIHAENISSRSELMTGHYFLFEGYTGKKDYERGLFHYQKTKEYGDSNQEVRTVKELQKLEIENYRVKDSLLNLEKNLKLSLAHEKEIQQKNSEKVNLAIGWAGSIAATSLFAFLIFKNTKRKQLKAEKERQEQIEEKEKILKDLELTTIDAMLTGQEKERERLAADLHDSVGATLSAAKLQFEYLIKHQNELKTSEDLIKKTSTLLEDAYVEVRSMAHLKNSGVMAKNGLLPAVQKLSNNASGINGLTIEVQNYGLEQRLNNPLEIIIFRIIQELITNIIKHANATKGLIYLTNHDDTFNIMVEDNGKGFDSKRVRKLNSGMGISSIDKRIAHLDGKFTIESEKSKGTTIIIDIPL